MAVLRALVFHNHIFLCVCSTSFLKTLWEKEKLLVTNNFSISQRFLPFLRTLCYFHQILNFCLQTLSVWKSLKFVVWEKNSALQRCIHSPSLRALSKYKIPLKLSDLKSEKKKEKKRNWSKGLISCIKQFFLHPSGFQYKWYFVSVVIASDIYIIVHIDGSCDIERNIGCMK